MMLCRLKCGRRNTQVDAALCRTTEPTPHICWCVSKCGKRDTDANLLFIWVRTTSNPAQIWRTQLEKLSGPNGDPLESAIPVFHRRKLSQACPPHHSSYAKRWNIRAAVAMQNVDETATFSCITRRAVSSNSMRTSTCYPHTLCCNQKTVLHSLLHTQQCIHRNLLFHLVEYSIAPQLKCFVLLFFHLFWCVDTTLVEDQLHVLFP